MKVITLLNEKGGVGKTTLATHIGAGLAVMGQRVVIIDADPQGHAGAVFGIDSDPGLYNLLVRGASFRDVLTMIPPELYEPPNEETSKGFLGIVPGNVETRSIAQQVDNVAILRQRIAELSEFADVIIFDTSPTPSLLHGIIYIATHGIIYPTELAALSFDGLMKSIRHRLGMAKTKSELGLEGLELLGIIPTKTRLRTVEHEENLSMLRQEYGDKVWSPTTLSVTWEEASMQRRSVFAYAPDSTAAKQGWSIVRHTYKALQTLKV